MPDSYIISDKQLSPSNKYPSDGSQNLIFNQFLNSILPSNTHPLSAAATHHFSSKGKQLRAKIALSAGEKFGADSSACLHWASAVELLHNASLIHDDICNYIDFGMAAKHSEYNFFKTRSMSEFLSDRIYIIYPYEFIYMYTTDAVLQEELDDLKYDIFRSSHNNYKLIHETFFKRKSSLTINEIILLLI